MSYPEVVRVLCGRAGSLLLQLSLVFRCAGLLIVYVRPPRAAPGVAVEHNPGQRWSEQGRAGQLLPACREARLGDLLGGGQDGC